MNGFKKIFRHVPSRVWFIVTCVLAVLLVVVNVVCSNTFVYDAICTVLGKKQAIYSDEDVQKSYEYTTDSKEDALEEANALTEEVAGEGIVLMRNEGGALPLAEGAKVSVFGKNSVNLVYSGSGSGSTDNSSAKTLYESLEDAGITYNPTLKNFYDDTSLSGEERGENSNFSTDMAKFDTGETPQSSYEAAGVESSYSEYSDAAVIVISRIGGEEFDLTNATLRENERHYLELDENEQALVEAVCGSFDKVILVVNSANVMELGFVESGEYGDIDACLWMGAPGNNGVMALGRILTGEVNPSGHTVDTWTAAAENDPTYNNFGDNGTDDGDRYTVSGKNKTGYFVDYEEGIYVGYRYYETADYEAGQGNYSGFSYEDQVVYPFGHGLSYTDFEWTLEDVSSLSGVTVSADGEYSVTVSVKNTGSCSGKDVIQIYASAPYTDGGIEKAHKVLCGFVKTDLLEPGEDQEYEIAFDPYDIASYDYSDANGNGFAGYELDGGDYTLYVSHSAHDTDDGFTVPFSVAAAGIQYSEDPDTGATVENRFEDADDQLGSLLSRADFAGTWPETRTDDEREVSQDFYDGLSDYDSGNDETYDTMPTTGASYDETVTFREVAGSDYDDEIWDTFMDQLTVSEMADLYNKGSFGTQAIERLGVPQTTISDGPVGFTDFQGSGTINGTCSYCCEVMMASTWNVELMAEIGASMAQEGLWGNQSGDGMPYSGIYAPGSNIHRSQFGGRNWEYFSEDGFLSGKLAAAEIEAAQEGGIVMFMKHFVLNEQETHRNANGLCTWANEQSIREIYLKPFEKAVKEGGTHGVMSSFNRVGDTWSGGSYALLTEVLRGEWGFEGTVVSDYLTASYSDVEQQIYAGGDLSLTITKYWESYSSSDAGDVMMLRRATKNVLYTIGNTNAMNGEIIGYRAPTWQIVMFVVSGVIAAGLVVWGVFAVRGALKKYEGQ